jgi:Ca2+-binding EF-hand superfamily protein
MPRPKLSLTLAALAALLLLATPAAPDDSPSKEQIGELVGKITLLVDSKFGGDWQRAFRSYARESKPKKTLEGHELAHVLQGGGIGDGTAAHPAVQAALEYLDANGNGKVTKREFRESFPAFAKWYRKALKRIRKRVRRRFDGDGAAAFDHYADPGGNLDHEGLVAMLKDAGIGNRITRGAWADGIIMHLDTDRDDGISSSEFVGVLRR